MSDIGITGDAQLTDDFATIADVPVEPTTDRISPNQVATGVTRGTQKIMNTDGSYMTLGQIPNSTDFGIAFYDSSGTLLSKTTGTTQYIYDKTTGKNIMQLMKLPDGTYGWAVARVGTNVADAFS